jgi:alpha-galactosidase
MVKDVAQSMLDQGLHAAGYTRVNLDDCWEATTRDPASGATRADPARFPSGTLKPLADWLHARNFSFGMYTSAGNETCSTGGRAIPGEPRARGVSGSWGHYAQDAATYASWGVDFVKLDWCIRDPSVSREARTTAFAAALDGSGREMWLNFHCEGAFQDWCARDGNSWRISEDHHDIWSNTAGVIEALATVNQRNQTGPHRWA